MTKSTIVLFETYLFLDRTFNEGLKLSVILRDAGASDAAKSVESYATRAYDLMKEIEGELDRRGDGKAGTQ